MIVNVARVSGAAVIPECCGHTRDVFTATSGLISRGLVSTESASVSIINDLVDAETSPGRLGANWVGCVPGVRGTSSSELVSRGELSPVWPWHGFLENDSVS